jgi:hypothetical protein
MSSPDASDPFRDDLDIIPESGRRYSSPRLEVKVGHHESLTRFGRVPTGPTQVDNFSMETFAAPPGVVSPSTTRQSCCSRHKVDFTEESVTDGVSDSPSADLPTVLLPSPTPEDSVKICLVLDLDETLIHSSFSVIPQADLIFSFGPEETPVTVSVRVRPGARQFLEDLAPLYELVVFTASVKTYADRVVDHIDPHG